MQKEINNITMRVYALIIKDNKILLSDEFMFDTPMTKFPGGGLEQGEGISDCLHREIEEEIGIKPIKIEHFHTCEKLITSDFVMSTQVIPIYYKVYIPEDFKIDTSEYRFDFKHIKNGETRLRWADIQNIDITEFTFKSDKEVFSLLLNTL